MYATLKYNSAVTTAQVLADVVAVATGNQGKTYASMPANANRIDNGSFLTSTLAGGWTVFDNIDATSVVLSSPISDDPSSIKYLKIEPVTNGLKFESYRSWNATAHTGVINKRVANNGSDYSSSNTEVNYVYLSTAGTASTVYLSINATHFTSQIMYNNSFNTTGAAMLTEHTRTSPWDTVANGYQPILYTWKSINGDPGTPTINAYCSWYVKPILPATPTTDYDINTGGTVVGKECSFTTAIQAIYISMAMNSNSGTQFGFPDTILGPDKMPTTNIQAMGAASRMFSDQPVGTGQCTTVGVTEKSGIYLCPMMGTMNSILTIGANSYRIWPAGDGNGNISTAPGTKYFAVLEA